MNFLTWYEYKKYLYVGNYVRALFLLFIYTFRPVYIISLRFVARAISLIAILIVAQFIQIVNPTVKDSCGVVVVFVLELLYIEKIV